MVAPLSTAARSGIVFDIQRASLHDGPGLRTTVFLKGCPLRCAWCHNPESQSGRPQTGASGKVYGVTKTLDEVMAIVEADRAFYEQSGGGLTMSGGEPTVQFEFCRAVLAAAKVQGIHTCLDTSGQVPTERLRGLLPLVDLFHYDLKLVEREKLHRWTGADADLIWKNLTELENAGARIIPGVNDDDEHRSMLDRLERSGRFEAVERLPYHTTGNAKYTDLGMFVPEFA